MLKKLLLLLALIVLIIPTFSTLLRGGYFPMHDDMQAMRLLQMDKCVQDGQIPCRWVPDMGYGYGYPQFNYYAPLPYYIMEGVHLTGFSFLDSVKVGFALSVVVGAVGMFLLGSSLWGASGGMISGLFYSYANYRAVDMYVRGAVGEFWALAFMPFVLWSIYGLFKDKRNAVVWIALSTAGLLTSHNISSLMFAPVVALWILTVSYLSDPSPISLLKKKLPKLIISFFWAFLMSAFFVLPAWFEKKYVHVETLLEGYFNYLAHFVGVKQLLLSSYFNYGGSEAGAYDEMSLSVGLLMWLIPLLVVGMLAFLKKTKKFKTSLFFIVVGWVGLFMTHSKSTFIWERISLLQYLQFPWRFLSIATFAFSAAVGALAVLLKSTRQKLVTIVGVFLVVFFFNSSYFQPVRWLNITDNDKFSGESWEKQLTISIFDYLPIYAKAPPAQEAPDEPVFAQGSGKVLASVVGTDWGQWEVFVDEAGQLRLPLYYFPNWKVKVDGVDVPIEYNNDLGLITFDVTPGQHGIFAKLYNTPIRSFSNILSLIGLLAVPLYFSKYNKYV